MPFFFVSPARPTATVPSLSSRRCRRRGVLGVGRASPPLPLLAQLQPRAPPAPPGTFSWCCSPEPSPAAGSPASPAPKWPWARRMLPRPRHPRDTAPVPSVSSPSPGTNPELGWAGAQLSKTLRGVRGGIEPGQRPGGGSRTVIERCRVGSALRETISVATFLHVGGAAVPQVWLSECA